MAAFLQSAAGSPKRKSKLPLIAVPERVDNSKFMILLNYTSWHDMCCMLGIFAVKSAVLNSSVSDTAELSRILELPLKKNALFLRVLLQWNLGLV